MREKLTEELLARLTVEKAKTIVWDALMVGIAALVRPSGHKSYVVQYRQGTGWLSKSVRITLDAASSVNLTEEAENMR